MQGGPSDVITSLDGPELDSDLKNYEEILKGNRRNLLHTHFIDSKKRADAQLQVLYVTIEDRAVAEDIKNATKDEIFRIAEKLLLIIDEEIKEPLSSKLQVLKAQPSKAKKETLLLLYSEIVEEIQNQETQEAACIFEEEGETDSTRTDFCIFMPAGLCELLNSITTLFSNSGHFESCVRVCIPTTNSNTSSHFIWEALPRVTVSVKVKFQLKYRCRFQ